MCIRDRSKHNILYKLKAVARKRNMDSLFKIFIDTKVPEKNPKDAENPRMVAGPIERQYKMYLGEIKENMDILGEYASGGEKGDLWSGNGRYDDVVAMLIEGKEHVAKMLDHVIERREDLETSKQYLDKRLFKYLNELGNQDIGTLGRDEALSILKAIGNRDRFAEYTLVNKGYKYNMWEDIANEPEYQDYTIWAPEKGHYMYTAYSVEDVAMNSVLVANLESMNISKSQIRKILAVGKKYKQFVIPSSLADTILDFNKPTGYEAPDSKAMKYIVRKWKQAVLLFPRRTLLYGARNLTGDLDHTILANPSALKYVPEAVTDMYSAIVQKKFKNRYVELYHEKGGFLALDVVQDIGRIQEFTDFLEHFGKKDYNIIKKAWRANSCLLYTSPSHET